MEKSEITKRKVILYGDGRFAKDFLYIFDWIKPEYYVDDIGDSVHAYRYTKLIEEKKGSFITIICKHDKVQAIMNLEAIGLLYDKDFIVADDLFKELDYPFNNKIKTKWIYVWGTGQTGHEFFHNFIEKKNITKIMGCIDSDMNKKGKRFFGFEIFSPEAVISNPSAFIVIASQYYQEIKKELTEHGLKESENFIPYEWLMYPASDMLRKTIYDIPQMDEVCKRPFEKAWINSDGRVKGCSSNNAIMGSLFFDSFDNIWHSNRMKVVRLSLINRTGTFCNKKRCELFDGKYCRYDVDDLHYSFEYSSETIQEMAQRKLLEKETIVDKDAYNLKESEYPDRVMISIDKTCNLSCPSCRDEVYIPSEIEKNKLKELTIKLQEEVIPHVDNIIMAGNGEVFASNVYKKILLDAKLKSKGKGICILSNGALFSPEYWKKVESIYTSIRVVISMDGATKETAEKLRRGVVFSEWLQNMNFLGEMRKAGRMEYLGFTFVVQRDNYMEMPLFCEKMLALGADEVSFSRIQNYGRWTDKQFETMTMFDEKENPKEELKEVLKNPILYSERVNLFMWHHGWK